MSAASPPTASDHHDLVVRPSQVLACRRLRDDRPSEGDEAVAELHAGLLQLLSLTDARGIPLGDGGAFAWTVPVGVAATAAYAVLEPVTGVNLWTGVKNAVRFHRAGRADETLIASCRLASLGTLAETPYRVWSRERGDLVVEGTFLSVPAAADAQGLYAVEARDTRATPAASRVPTAPVSAATADAAPALDGPSPGQARITTEEDLVPLETWSPSAPGRAAAGEAEPAPLFAMRRPRVMRTSGDGDAMVWEWSFPRDLLRLLLHPLAGGTEPLGRRHHPFGRILEGMAIHATLRMTGANAPVSLNTRLVQPIAGDEDFRVRSRLGSPAAGPKSVEHEIYEGERAVARVRVTVAAHDLRASKDGATRPPAQDAGAPR